MKKNDININCDLGEGASNEEAVMNYIQGCSIACGGHYGNSQSIYQTLSKAIDHQLDLGAHPSYPDLEHFGRVSMKMSRTAFLSSIQKQLDQYFDQLSKFKTTNNHIKAHGALYNDLCDNQELCEWFLEATKPYTFKSLYTPFNGELAKISKEKSVPVSFEAFIDRNYNDAGRLVSRALPKAEKESVEEVYKQLKNILTRGVVTTVNSIEIKMKADTFCLHGDHPKALERVQYINKQLH